ncbi:hypothetical protein BBOV_III004160 [Babesia bovis T2Bo]|uniref:Uncharacterized protein n=1 Tax=Babesia bovis TaxID=5865 RepID=A7AN45_BABBO|nr:hypothetical protein BBOV_III004160 [Babesia bovis T2Bo]EDO07979.1 hypothetical protein BBOV_III004160 [Babesia bovis T2Bo]|eukprot:XP_001611547.1 hypothetical protein [Babesia bovis T2Bo]
MKQHLDKTFVFSMSPGIVFAALSVCTLCLCAPPELVGTKNNQEDQIDPSIPKIKDNNDTPSALPNDSAVLQAMINDADDTMGHLTAIITVLNSFNTLLGYTDDSISIRLIERLGEVYVDLEDPKREKALYRLLNDAKLLSANLTQTINDVEAILQHFVNARSRKELKNKEHILLPMLSKLLNKTLGETMDMLISMRDNSFKAELLRKTDFSLLHADETTALVNALTNTYGKTYEVDPKDLEHDTLHKKIKVMNDELNEQLQWLNQQSYHLTLYTKFSCPLEPPSNHRPLCNRLIPINRNPNSTSMLYHHLYMQIYEYGVFLNASSAALKVLTTVTESECQVKFIHLFYANTVKIVRTIMDTRFLSTAQKVTFRLQLQNLISPFSSMMSMHKSVGKEYSFSSVTTQPIKSYEYKKIMLNLYIMKLLFLHYQNQWELLHPLLRFCHVNNDMNSMDFEPILTNSVTLVIRNKALQRSIESMTERYQEGLEMQQKTLQALASSKEIPSDLRMQLIQQKSEQLNTISIDLYIEYNLLCVIISDSLSVRTSANQPLNEEALAEASIFVHFEMVRYIYETIDTLYELLEVYRGIQQRARELFLTLTSIRVNGEELHRSKCLSVLDNTHDYFLSRRIDLEEILGNRNVGIADVDTDMKIFDDINLYVASYKKGIWKSYFKKFFSDKCHIHDILTMRIYIWRMEEMFDEFVILVNRKTFQMTELQNKIKQCRHRNDELKNLTVTDIILKEKIQIPAFPKEGNVQRDQRTEEYNNSSKDIENSHNNSNPVIKEAARLHSMPSLLGTRTEVRKHPLKAGFINGILIISLGTLLINSV